MYKNIFTGNSIDMQTELSSLWQNGVEFQTETEIANS